MDHLGLPEEAMLLAEDAAAAVPKEYQSLFKSMPRRELDEQPPTLPTLPEMRKGTSPGMASWDIICKYST